MVSSGGVYRPASELSLLKAVMARRLAPKRQVWLYLQYQKRLNWRQGSGCLWLTDVYPQLVLMENLTWKQITL